MLFLGLIGAALLFGAVTLLRFALRGSLPPNLSDSPTLMIGKSYDYRIPLGGCASPIVHVNGRNWEPDRLWTAPYPEHWRIVSEGSKYHVARYLVGTARAEAHRLVVGLPDETVVNTYHPMTTKILACA